MKLECRPSTCNTRTFFVADARCVAPQRLVIRGEVFLAQWFPNLFGPLPKSR